MEIQSKTWKMSKIVKKNLAIEMNFPRKICRVPTLKLYLKIEK